LTNSSPTLCTSPLAATMAGVVLGDGKVECFLIVHNVAKKTNIGTLSRCATAFNVSEIIMVGSRSFNTFGSQGADAYVTVKHCPTLDACRAYLKDERGCEIIGVEIRDDAFPVQSQGFKGNTAFILGNEGQGMTDKQMEICDRFVYIPQYGPGTASLNVAVAASIVLHTFAVWAGYQENSRSGYKYDVADRPQRTAPRGEVPLTQEEKAALRARRTAGAPMDDDEISFELFDEEGTGAGAAGSLGGGGESNALEVPTPQRKPEISLKTVSQRSCSPDIPESPQVQISPDQAERGGFFPC